MERAVAAARKPHAHCITRVTNASGIEFRNEQRRDEQRGQIMASCTMFSAARREDLNLGMAESKSVGRRFDSGPRYRLKTLHNWAFRLQLDGAILLLVDTLLIPEGEMRRPRAPVRLGAAGQFQPPTPKRCGSRVKSLSSSCSAGCSKTSLWTTPAPRLSRCAARRPSPDEEDDGPRLRCCTKPRPPTVLKPDPPHA